MGKAYDGKLYILAFDHRGSYSKNMFNISGDPTPEELEAIVDSKRLIYEGMEIAVERGVEAEATGVLVDEQTGGEVPQLAKEHGLRLAIPAEESGRPDFEFQYGEDFPSHITSIDPDFVKVLVRLNPEGDAEMNETQLGKLKRLADWCEENDYTFLFELLVPAEPHQLESVGGDNDRYDAELRPELMRRAIEQIQDYGVVVDIWKIEGVDAREDAEMLAQTTRRGGRDQVKSVLLGRGASDEKVDHWLRQAAGVEGFIGFAIGRSIWMDALKGYLAGDLDRRAAAEKNGESYLRFVEVYRGAESGAAV